MFRKIMNILFDEEEIVVKEPKTQEEAYDIPSIKPLREPVPSSVMVEETTETEVVSPVVAEEFKKEEVVVEPSAPIIEKPRGIRIDADGPKAKPKESRELHFPKSNTNVPYEPVRIISPIYGGPKREEKDLQVVKPVVSKKREPITQVISPMFGQVESSSSLGDIEPEILELNVDEMHTNQDFGVEIQASLYDMIEGLEDEE